MSNQSAETIRDARRDWMIEHRNSYLRSGGAEGHIMNLTAVGGHSFATHCLIKYRGCKSGRVFITPLCYADLGGEVVICASKGGADEHPAWYLNMLGAEMVEFQIATQAFRATWREPANSERDAVWAFLVNCFPFYQTYQDATSRTLPLVMLKAVAPISVFTVADATGERQL